jgi:hypothetical protein
MLPISSMEYLREEGNDSLQICNLSSLGSMPNDSNVFVHNEDDPMNSAARDR